jgi:hypothetical protein
MVLTNDSSFDGEEGRRQELQVGGGRSVGGVSEGASAAALSWSGRSDVVLEWWR